MNAPYESAQAPANLDAIDRNPMPVCARATDYPAGHHIAPHSHAKGQLIHSVSGVMVVAADGGQWIVPPTRGLWMPAGVVHAIRCIGEVHMRCLWVRPEAAPQLPAQPRSVGISPLLRELILVATGIGLSYAADSRDGRLMRLALDEIEELPILPLHLPQPTDPRLRRICAHLSEHPDDDSTLAHWAERLEVDAKTIQRLFSRETGMTFGEWRQQSRLLRGLELLAGGDKVLDVALALGYESPSAFAAMFRRQFGETPSAFFR
jgi:AraC-like DNA-binding protein/quercetin dioxygenase-like cupin family protein